MTAHTQYDVLTNGRVGLQSRSAPGQVLGSYVICRARVLTVGHPPSPVIKLVLRNPNKKNKKV